MNQSFPDTGNIEDLMDVEGADEMQNFDAEFESLSLRGHQSESYAIHNLGSSVLDINDLSNRNSIREYLTGISSVKHLNISFETLKIIHQYCKLEPLPKFYNLSELEATLGWEMFPMFLQGCPNLKSLVLDWACPVEMEKIKLSSVPQCLLSSLEDVEIKRPITGEAVEMELIEYILGNSKVLNSIVIPIGCSYTTEKANVIQEELWKYSCGHPCLLVYVFDS